MQRGRTKVINQRWRRREVGAEDEDGAERKDKEENQNFSSRTGSGSEFCTFGTC